MTRRRSVLTCMLPFGAAAYGETSKRTLLVGDVPPYAAIAGDRPTGLTVELVQAISERSAMPVAPRVVPMSRAFLEARSGEPSLVIPVSRLGTREGLLKWLVPLVPVRLMFFARAATGFDISTLNAVGSLRVGALRAPGLEELYRASGVARLDFVTSNEVAVRMLMADRLDAILTADGSALHQFRAMGITRSEIREGAVVAITHLWLAGSLSLPEKEAAAWREAGTQFLNSAAGKQMVDRRLQLL